MITVLTKTIKNAMTRKMALAAATAAGMAGLVPTAAQAHERHRVLVCPAHYDRVERQVIVCDGHWENIERQVLVREGGYHRVERQELVTPGHYESRTERVEVVPGRWETCGVASTGFDFRFRN